MGAQLLNKIKIIGAYDEIAWYSKLIGKTFEVLEQKEDGHIKVKRGNGRYSYWVGPDDYENVEG